MCIRDRKPYLCHMCDKMFHALANLNIHMRVHTREQRYLCRICDKAFSHRAALNSHTRVHTELCTCSPCDESVRRLRSFQADKCLIHSSTTDEPKPAYLCQVCDKAFSRRGQLVAHIRVHTGEKPFKCHMCNKAFSRSSTLNAHLRGCLLYTSPSPRDGLLSRMPSSA